MSYTKFLTFFPPFFKDGVPLWGMNSPTFYEYAFAKKKKKIDVCHFLLFQNG